MNVSDQHDALFDQPQGRAACQMHKWVVEQFNIIFILTTTQTGTDTLKKYVNTLESHRAFQNLYA